jgi:hypothetical protein
MHHHPPHHPQPPSPRVRRNVRIAQVETTGLPGTPSSVARYNVTGVGPGDNVTLYSASNVPTSLTVSPAAGCPSNANFWGSMFANGGSAAAPVPASAEMQIAPCNSGLSPNASQTFTVTPVSGSWSQIVLTASVAAGQPLCLTVSSCAPSEDSTVFLADCVAPAPANASEACYDAFQCSNAVQLWSFNSNYQPHGLQSQVGSDAGAAWCLDMPGAYGPVVDLYSCDTNSEQYSNQDWFFNATSGAIVSLLSRPGWGPGFCLTVPSASA